MPPARACSLLLASLAALAQVGCSADRPPPASVDQARAPAASGAAAPPNTCDAASTLRARVPGLLAEGKLERAARVLDRAQSLCPERRATEASQHLKILADLNHFRQLDEVAARIEKTPGASPAAIEVARSAWTAAAESRGRLEPPDPFSTIHAALAARAKGDHASAQRGFDQALGAIERVTGERAFIDVGGMFGDPAWVGWSASGSELAVHINSSKVVAFDATPFRETLRVRPRELAESEGLERALLSLATGAWPAGSYPLGGAHSPEHEFTCELGEPISAQARSADGSTMALGGLHGKVSVCRRGERAPRLVRRLHRSRVTDVALSRDGITLVSASWPYLRCDYSVCSGDEPSRPERFERSLIVTRASAAPAVIGRVTLSRRPSAAAVSDDGRTVALSFYGGSIELWPAGGSGPITSLKDGHLSIMSLAFRPDGARLAAASKERMIHVWDVATGKVVRVLRGQGREVYPLPAGGASAVIRRLEESSAGGRPLPRAVCGEMSEPPAAECAALAMALSALASISGSRIQVISDFDYGFLLYAPSTGELLGRAFPIKGSDAALVMASTGHVSIHGSEARDHVVCRVGPYSLPIDVCEDRLVVPGLLARLLAGDRSFLEP